MPNPPLVTGKASLSEYSLCNSAETAHRVMESSSPNLLAIEEEARGAPSYGSCWGAQFQLSCGAECTPNFIPGKRHSMVRRITRICRAGRPPPPTARGTLTHAHGGGLVSSTQSCGHLGLAALNKAADPLHFRLQPSPECSTPPANHPGDTSRASSATAAVIASWCRSPGSAPSAPSSPRASSTSAPRASGTVHPRTWVAAAWSD